MTNSCAEIDISDRKREHFLCNWSETNSPTLSDFKPIFHTWLDLRGLLSWEKHQNAPVGFVFTGCYLFGLKTAYHCLFSTLNVHLCVGIWHWEACFVCEFTKSWITLSMDSSSSVKVGCSLLQKLIQLLQFIVDIFNEKQCPLL